MQNTDPITWTETTEDRYNDMLEVLPPAAMIGSAFLVGEPSDHCAATGQPRFEAFRQRGAVYLVASRPMTIRELRDGMVARPVNAEWRSYAVTFTVLGRESTWTRFAPDDDHATASATEDLAKEYRGKATLLSVAPCPDPRTTKTAKE